jgi:hypothetical protein
MSTPRNSNPNNIRKTSLTSVAFVAVVVALSASNGPANAMAFGRSIGAFHGIIAGGSSGLHYVDGLPSRGSGGLDSHDGLLNGGHGSNPSFASMRCPKKCVTE